VNLSGYDASSRGALPAAPPQTGKLWRWLKMCFAALGVGAIVFAVGNSWHFLAALWPRIDGALVAAAALVWMGLHFLAPLTSVLVLSKTRPLSYTEALRIHALRLPARYIPGGIWHTVGRVVDLAAVGYSRRALTEFVLVENLTAAGFTLGVGAALISWQQTTTWSTAAGIFAVFCLVAYCLIPFAMRLLGGSDSAISTTNFLRVSAVVALFWAGASCAFVLFAKGFADGVFGSSVAQIAGCYLFSWGAGFVAIFAPQGVGVFEYVAGKLLSGNAGILDAVSVMAAFRLVVLAADLGAWLIVLLLAPRPAAGASRH
jgi:glycosyltransferase 2 family protein